jgi:serine/threonine protein kinase
MVERVYHDALARPVAGRAAFVAEACGGDEELRREARMLAALNHPHIAAIHGVEESDGVRALVLELVEGETLAERIERYGPWSGLEGGTRARDSNRRRAR